MKIDILSDLHFDNYFYNKYSKDDVINFYSQIIDFNNCGDVLVIAGDLGHNNHQNIKILKILKEFYKNIVCVLGNHDYYLIDKENKSLFKSSFERVSNMRELINKEYFKERKLKYINKQATNYGLKLVPVDFVS